MTENLAAALVAFQAELPHVGKGKKADTGKFSYTYAGLDDIAQAAHPVLAKHGLAFSCYPTLTDDGRFVLTYELVHTSGESKVGHYPLPDPAQTPPQSVGSAVTYARRYCLQSVTGIVAEEDDDAQAAQGTTAKKAERGPVAEDPWKASDPVAVEEWKQVVAAASDKDQLASAWADLNALCSTGQVTVPDRVGLVDLWNARKAEVLGKDTAA